MKLSIDFSDHGDRILSEMFMSIFRCTKKTGKSPTLLFHDSIDDFEFFTQFGCYQTCE